MSENKYPIGGYAPLKQLLDDLIECVINDRLILGATPNGRPHDPDPEIDRLRKEILNIYGKPAGAVWVKASEFKPESSTHRPFRLKHDNGYLYGGFFVSTTDGKVYLSDNGKYIEQHNDRWANYEILDESGAGSNENMKEVNQ